MMPSFISGVIKCVQFELNTSDSDDSNSNNKNSINYNVSTVEMN